MRNHKIITFEEFKDICMDYIPFENDFVGFLCNEKDLIDKCQYETNKGYECCASFCPKWKKLTKNNLKIIGDK